MYIYTSMIYFIFIFTHVYNDKCMITCMNGYVNIYEYNNVNIINIYTCITYKYIVN